MSVMYVLFTVTIKTTFCSHKSPCPLCCQSLPPLSSIKYSQCHLGDLHKFCKTRLFLQPLANEDPSLQRLFFWKTLQAQRVLVCPSRPSQNEQLFHVKCRMCS